MYYFNKNIQFRLEDETAAYVANFIQRMLKTANHFNLTDAYPVIKI